MTPQPSEQPVRPLTTKEEAEMRHDLDPFDAYQYGGWAHLVGRLFATLDEARAAAPDPVASPPEAVTLLRRWLSAWRAMELGPPRADLVAATSRFVHSQEATDDLPVATPALDVERLARAIDASWGELLAPLGGLPDGLGRSAKAVAAAYESEGQPVAEDRE